MQEKRLKSKLVEISSPKSVPNTSEQRLKDTTQCSAEEVTRRYFRLYPRLSRLGANVEQAVKHFLEKEHIGYVSVSHRVKQLDRFLEKIARKGYHRPFKQTKDLVGIRIVCFFQSDVSRIADLLSQEFNV